MTKLKLWELDKEKKYVDQDKRMWYWDSVSWIARNHDRSLLSHHDYGWIHLEELEFTEHEPLPEKKERKLYAYEAKFINNNIALKGYSRWIVFAEESYEDTEDYQRAPEYDLTFEDK